MPSLLTAGGVLGSGALLALLIAIASPDGTDSVAPPSSISLPTSVAAQFGASLDGGGSTIKLDGSSTAETSTPGGSGGANGDSGGALGMNLGQVPMVWANQPVIPTAQGVIAEKVRRSLDSELATALDSTLSDLPGKLASELELPVLLDSRGIDFAEVQPAETMIRLDAGRLPLATSLRQALQPLGLKAVVENDGLVITADPAALVHRGIGTTRWINIDDDQAASIIKQLDQTIRLELIQTPLSEALIVINDQHQMSILVDDRALEEIGLSSNEPVTLAIDNVKLQTAISLMLQPLDLTLTINGETLVVTTREAAEQRLLGRVYWLEGTGIASGDYESIIRTVQSAITPDTWEALGGPSTITPVGSARPALLISTTLEVHRDIESLLQTLRQNHFGVEPVLEPVRVPAPAGGGFGGQMGGFGGGMGGGGGFF
jgi:hypothetical protein